FAPLLEAGRFATRAALWRYAAGTGATVGAIALFAAFDFRRFGAEGLYPAGYAAPPVSFVRLPAETLWGASPWAALGLTGLALTAVFAVSRYSRMDEARTLWALALTAALTQQLALAASLTFVLIARSPWDRALARRLALVAACSGAWIVAAASQGMPRGELRIRLFGWPEFVYSIVRPWAQVLPWLGLVIAAALAWTLLRGRRAWLATLGSPAGVAAYSIACLGLVRYFYEGTRYHFFLYAVLLAAVAVAAAHLLGANRGAAVFLAVFALGGDFHPLHIADPAGEEASLRMGRFAGLDPLWYPRADYRSAAEALRELADNGQTGVVIGTAEPVAYAFEGQFARYLDRSEYPFHEQSRRAGTVEVWAGRRLLSTAEELRAWSKPYGAMLLVRRYPGDARELDPKAVWGDAAEAERVWVSRDGGVDIVRVTLPR
ncbi:MAG: hypothetical protein KDC27_06090, partial [Acidobacteria bacterium]|nr:hypothetical protein [Acidobacteriota bacterium]